MVNQNNTATEPHNPSIATPQTMWVSTLSLSEGGKFTNVHQTAVENDK